MGVIILGLFSNSLTGLQGAIILSLAHGLVSPALLNIIEDYLFIFQYFQYFIFYLLKPILEYLYH
jgi:NADH-ubiquinone oxidoreductase chain 4